MRKDLQALFRTFSSVEPSTSLRDAVLFRLFEAEIRRARAQFVFSGVAALFSFVGLFFAAQFTAREFLQSDFYSYFSLVFSDSSLVLSFWREFLLSLVESFPTLGALLAITSFFALLFSVQFVGKNIRSTFSMSHAHSH